jgi:hypothetical protein
LSVEVEFPVEGEGRGRDRKDAAQGSGNRHIDVPLDDGSGAIVAEGSVDIPKAEPESLGAMVSRRRGDFYVPLALGRVAGPLRAATTV